MALQELFPYITVVHAELTDKWQRRDPNSSTVKLLTEKWNTKKDDWKTPDGKVIKERGLGDKLAEEGTELGAARKPEEIIEESSQALWALMASWIKLGIKPGGIFNLTMNLLQQPIILPEKEGKLAENAGTAVSRINGVGAAKDKMGVAARSAQALIAMHALWESKGISPSDVGEKI